MPCSSGCEDHNHEQDIEPFKKESLLGNIDIDNIRCLNEAEEDSAKQVFKPYEDCLSEEKFLRSDCDEQLLIFVPFTGQVKLKSISLKVGRGGSAPDKMKVYINHESIDFDTVEDLEEVQSWDLVSEHDGVIEYNTRISKFNRVRNLTLFFPSNFGNDSTIIYYIGLRGEFMEMKQAPIVTVYEVQPNVKDHKIPGIGNTNNHQIG
ncbi:UPF0424 family protein [Neoconidiobolus thromboides FSU 785]|nr:UPF0424 family protein [Neoconidiobolus thromboides FSU 785]